jgi:hypothetical protein
VSARPARLVGHGIVSGPQGSLRVLRTRAFDRDGHGTHAARPAGNDHTVAGRVARWHAVIHLTSPPRPTTPWPGSHTMSAELLQRLALEGVQ